ncbi:MAG: amidohydrolase family protein [Gammaproteobacteria bacterium]|nr:amidohydrolase family protein [Gammaproteobacteria bacterium]
MRTRIALTICLLPAALASANDVVTTADDLAVDVSPVDGRIVMDLAGDIWTLPAGGGEATLLVDEDFTLRRPSWSPDGGSVLYHASGVEGSGIWVTDASGSARTRISASGMHEQDAGWHPDGERIVFASDRHGSGLDIWERDLPTGLAWRLTGHPANEFEPAWSANGRHLAWIRRDEDAYRLMLRRRDEADIVVLESAERISSLSWRPDGSLLTYVRHDGATTTLEMVILSEPVLVRVIESGERLETAPISWYDRHSLYYTAGGLIRTRGFEDRRSRPLNFRAFLRPVEAPPPRAIARRELDVIDPPDGRLIIRGTRLFDGLWPGYRQNMDVVVERGLVVAVEARRPRDDGTVLDLGDVTIMPGLVDAWSAPVQVPGAGSAVLAYGVTTLVTDEAPVFNTRVFEGESLPGPRIVVVDDPGEVAGAVSIADPGTDAIDGLLQSRQARALGHGEPPPRRFASTPDLRAAAPLVVAGSKPNHLAPGLALQAELLALREAGLTAEQALHAAGRNAARALGLEFQVGTIVSGAVADLLLVGGDPLRDVGDSLKIVAVVRNGRFYSLVSLLERATAAATVE